MEPRKNDSVTRLTLVIWASVGAIILTWVFLQLAADLHIVWLPMVFCFGLVVILEPLVDRFIRMNMSRPMAVTLTFVVLTVVVAIVLAAVVPTVRSQGEEFVGVIPDIADRTIDWATQVGDRIGVEVDPSIRDFDLQAWINDPENRESLQGMVDWTIGGAGRVLKGVVEFVTILLLAPILAFYLLLDIERARKLFYDLVPHRLRSEVRFVASHLGSALGGFVRGQLLVALVVGILGSVAMAALGLPFWLIIGMASGVLNLVPFIGPVAGAILAGMVALLQGEPAKALLAVALFTAIQQLDNHVITPLVQRARVRLSPLVIVLALIGGGAMAGLVGVLIAVPGLAAVRVVAGHLWRTRVLGESWQQASEAAIEITLPPGVLLPILRREGGEGESQPPPGEPPPS